MSNSKKYSDVLDDSSAYDPATGIVFSNITVDKLLRVEIEKTESDTSGSDNSLTLSVSFMPYEMVARGYEFMEVIVADIEKETKDHSTPEEVREELKRKKKVKKPKKLTKLERKC